MTLEKNTKSKSKIKPKTSIENDTPVTTLVIPSHSIERYKSKSASKVNKLIRDVKVGKQALNKFKDANNPALYWINNYFQGEKHANKLDLNNSAYVTADEVKPLIEDYFLTSIKNEMNISVVGLAGWLGVTTPTLLRWSRGDIPTNFQEEIQRAIQAIHAYKDDLAERGMINGVVHIFNSKNFYGMRDVSEIHSNVRVAAVSEKEKKTIIDKLF